MSIKRFAGMLLIGLLLLSGALAAAQDTPTIADIVVASASGEMPEFTMLLAAVQAADPAVLEVLSDPEAELTVFAPTDAAFEALGEETLNAVLADQELLTNILLFHVVPGASTMSSDVLDAFEANDGAFSLPSAQGQYIDFKMDEMGVITVNGNAKLVMDMLDIEAANGVIHVIDAVILPETRTIADIVVDSSLAEEPEFTMLLAAVNAADPAVLEALSDPEAELTVFAPTDAAFEALGEETLNAVLADQELLTSILLYHVVAGKVYYGDVVVLLTESEGEPVTVETLNGAMATISLTDDGVFIDNAQIVITDIDAANGVIHVIDAVILPPSN
ncbi:MAG: fasciclin domain-containing protein [Aggregatilineales bacterium]